MIDPNKLPRRETRVVRTEDGGFEAIFRGKTADFIYQKAADHGIPPEGAAEWYLERMSAWVQANPEEAKRIFLLSVSRDQTTVNDFRTGRHLGQGAVNWLAYSRWRNEHGACPAFRCLTAAQRKRWRVRAQQLVEFHLPR